MAWKQPVHLVSQTEFWDMPGHSSSKTMKLGLSSENWHKMDPYTCSPVPPGTPNSVLLKCCVLCMCAYLHVCMHTSTSLTPTPKQSLKQE